MPYKNLLSYMAFYLPCCLWLLHFRLAYLIYCKPISRMSLFCVLSYASAEFILTARLIGSGVLSIPDQSRHITTTDSC